MFTFRRPRKILFYPVFELISSAQLFNSERNVRKVSLSGQSAQE